MNNFSLACLASLSTEPTAMTRIKKATSHLITGLTLLLLGTSLAHAQVPAAPTNPIGITVSVSQINLSWTDNSNNETGFKIERKTGAGSFAQIASVGANVNTLSDTGLSTATAYVYRVRATNGSGDSSYTSEVTTSTSSTTPVGAWGLNNGNGATAADYSGNNLTGAVYSARPTSAGKFYNGLLFDGSKSYVDLGNPGKLQISGSMTISAWIKAAAHPGNDAAIVSKIVDSGPYGGFQLDTTVDTGPRTIGFKLFDPNNNYMFRYGASTLQLDQWYHVAGVYDAGAQTMVVYLNGALDNGTLLGTVASTQLGSSQPVFFGQRPDSFGQYNFNGAIDEVRIYNRALTQSEVQADMNAAVTSSSADTTAPSAPSGLTGVSPGTTQINLIWTSSTDTYDVSEYRVERCQGASCANFVDVAAAATLSYYDAGLTAGTTYRYRVRAADIAGNLSAYSSIATIATPGAAPSGGPVGAYAFEEGSGTTTADASGSNYTGSLTSTTWTASGKYGNGLVFNGTTSSVSLGTPSGLQISGSMTVSAWVKANAVPVDDATIVSKHNNDGPGFPASRGGFQLDTTVDTGPRTIGFKMFDPVGFLVARYGATTLQLNQWYHVAGVYDAATQTMVVYLNGAADNGTLLGPVPGIQRNSSLATFIGRRGDTAGQYNFNGTIDDVRIYTRALSQTEIQADMNSAVGGTPPDTTPPTAPTGLSATAQSASQINLAWTASTDNVGVTGYRVERCQGASCSSFAEIATPTSTSFSDTSLSSSTSYSYRVRASDAVPNLGSYSSVASATTAAPPAAQLYYIHPDHLNTPRVISNQAQQTVWRWDNDDPFGANMANASPSGLGTFEFNLRYPGQYFDKETNNHYNYFRDYSPEIGRYIESDPIGLGGGINTYAYVGGNPLSYTDPTGLAGSGSNNMCVAVDPFSQCRAQCRVDCIGSLGKSGRLGQGMSYYRCLNTCYERNGCM